LSVFSLRISFTFKTNFEHRDFFPVEVASIRKDHYGEKSLNWKSIFSLYRISCGVSFELNCMFERSFFHSCVSFFVRSFVCLFVYLFVHLYVCLYVCLFVCLFVCSFRKKTKEIYLNKNEMKSDILYKFDLHYGVIFFCGIQHEKLWLLKN